MTKQWIVFAHLFRHSNFPGGSSQLNASANLFQWGFPQQWIAAVDR
jgi:hypothetical protein